MHPVIYMIAGSVIAFAALEGSKRIQKIKRDISDNQSLKEEVKELTEELDELTLAHERVLVSKTKKIKVKKKK